MTTEGNDFFREIPEKKNPELLVEEFRLFFLISCHFRFRSDRIKNHQKTGFEDINHTPV